MTPFFIVGCARTGTTLLRTMLNHHPEVAIPLESLFIVDYLRQGDDVPIEKLKALIVAECEIKEWGLQLRAEDIAACQNVRELINRIHEIYTTAHDKEKWGQKTPRFVRYGSLFKQYYPDAKFIHVIRDPRAVTNSLIRSNIHNSNALFGAKRWLKDTTYGRQLKQQYPDDVLEIRYEDLVIAPEVTLRSVTDFLGLNFDEAMLRYHETGLQEYAKHQAYYQQTHERISKPPSPDRIEAWREKLDSPQIEVIEAICGDLMQELGYQKDFETPQLHSAIVRRLRIERGVGISKQIMNYLRRRRCQLFYSVWRKHRLGLLWGDFAQINY